MLGIVSLFPIFSKKVRHPIAAPVENLKLDNTISSGSSADPSFPTLAEEAIQPGQYIET